MATSSTFRIPKATITGLYGRALSAYARRSWGQVPDNAYVLWHNKKGGVLVRAEGREVRRSRP